MSCGPVSKRLWSVIPLCHGMATLLVVILLPSLASAGMLVGTGTGNDHKPDVVAILNGYNATHDPDLTTDIDLFKKTDDDAAFVFNMANGFMFFSDAAGTMPVTTEAQLTSLSTAYFKYTGPENLLYYSQKSGNNINLYTFMAGLNIMNVSSQNLSHGSFWSGPPPIGDPFVPEPTTAVLMLGAAAYLAASWRRR